MVEMEVINLTWIAHLLRTRKLQLKCPCAAGKFFWYFLFLFLTLLYYTYYGILTIVISPSVQVR